MNSRIEKLYEKMAQPNLDGLIVSLPANITYLTGYLSRDSYFLVSPKGNIYFTDSRYTAEAKRQIQCRARIIEVKGSIFKLIADTCLDLKLKNIGFEGRYLPFAEFQKIKEYLKKGASLHNTHSLVEELRQVKQPQELAKIRQATKITVCALEFAKEFISPGKTELEVVGELERFIRYQGATGPAFEIIVASGPNSSFAHHIPSKRKIKNNEPVMVDIGVEYQGYKSDLTRVFFLGKITNLGRRVYETVRLANELAISAVKPGCLAADIDKAGRQYIESKGFGRFFGHNLGHGVGLEVHESPHISPKENLRLKPGVVFTIEPAIYLAGRFGVRIEDMVLVTKKGYEVLSGALDK